MATTAYKRTLLTGGTADALDSIDGNDLTAGDFAFVLVGGTMYIYQYKDYGTPTSDSSPDIIQPDSNPGNYAWQLQEPPFLWSIPSGANASGGMSGYTLSNNGSDADHDLDVSVGHCWDSTGTYQIALSTAITKKLDATWAAGDDAGGLLNGSIAASKCYHVFAIYKESDGTVDVGFLNGEDTAIEGGSGIGAYLPSGYTNYRWIGYVLTDGSSNIVPFTHNGNLFTLTDGVLAASSIQTLAQKDLSSTCPSGHSVKAKVMPYDSTGGFDVWFNFGSASYVVTSMESSSSTTFIGEYNLSGWVHLDSASKLYAYCGGATVDLYLIAVEVMR